MTAPPPGTPQSRAISVVVFGVRSPVIDAGPPRESEAVVFVHGNPGTGHDWYDLVARVSYFARAIAPDMPGFGQADKPPDFDYTVDGTPATSAVSSTSSVSSAPTLSSTTSVGRGGSRGRWLIPTASRA
jgi:pimeloyl-ACP methyl ester carboxylesterase